MRLERISDFEIKAYLTIEDIKEFGINDVNRLDRGAVDIVLGIAKSELDFCYKKSNCEIYTEQDGSGCTLTIKANAGEKRAVIHRCILCFSDKDDLYTACLFLQNFRLQQSELREEYDGRNKTYYLVINYFEGELLTDGRPYWLLSVSELCQSVHNDKNAFFYYICEHCTPVIKKNAVYYIANSEKK